MENKNKKQKKILIILILLLFIPVIWFLFLNKSDKHAEVSNQLVGKWLRYDGVYSIEIKNVNKDGSFSASYYNPNSIQVGATKWYFKNKKLHIEIELLGPYQKSKYQLSYDESKKILAGTFYQAVAKETYEVYFEKVK